MIYNADFAILTFIQDHLRTPLGDGLMPVLTALGNAGVIWIVLGLVLLLRKRWRRAGFLVLLALGVEALFCNVLLKPLIARPRPFQIYDVVQLLIAQPLDYSFPSGHTGAAFAVVAALYFAKVRHWYVALIPALVIAFSRLYLYVHFPTDVLGGIVIGVFSAWLVWKVFVLIESYRTRKRQDCD
ncbi:MAG: phosphatase PAP2 family protein [Peptococcaceae bacterium]|nr:phosphatase PAP2 family protein [Peptococcaceae bacterium]